MPQAGDMAPRWGRILTVLDLAEKYQRAPSTWLNSRLTEWGPVDRALTLAFALYRAERTCQCCGIPARWAHGSLTEGWWTAKTVTCQVRAARERHERELTEPAPGALTTTVLEEMT